VAGRAPGRIPLPHGVPDSPVEALARLAQIPFPKVCANLAPLFTGSRRKWGKLRFWTRVPVLGKQRNQRKPRFTPEASPRWARPPERATT
jgi:hypothetical protein